MASFIPVDGEIDEIEAPTTLAEFQTLLGGVALGYKHAPGDDIWIWAEDSKDPANDRATQWSGRWLPIHGPCLYCSAKEAPAVLPIVRMGGRFVRSLNMNHDSFLLGYADPVGSESIDTILNQIKSLIGNMQPPIIPNYNIGNVGVGPKWDTKLEYYTHGYTKELTTAAEPYSYFDPKAVMALVTSKSRT